MNMKATLWLWSLVTTLLYVSQQVSAEPYADTRILQPQDNSLVAPAKRTKASLSIVNPLDVLRQRIILEMARRRMQENSMQVARNKAILREIGKRSRDEFPQEDAPLNFGSQDRFYYGKLPLQRRFSHARSDRQLGGFMEYDLDPAENRKSTGASSSSSINSRDRNDNDSTISEAGKQINDRKEISSSGSSSRGDGSRGVLTLAAEQRQLEREQQEAQQEANKILHSVAIVGPQEMRFSDERVMLPNGGVGANDGDDEDDDDGGNGDNGLDEGDEYFQGSHFPSGREQQQQQQQQQPQLQQKDDRLKSDDYRLRYLYRIQGKYFG